MTKNKKIFYFIISPTIFLFVGCSSAKIPERKGGFTYSSIYFGKVLNPNLKHGIIDGCTTAKGKYQKIHYLFKNNNYYNKGWFLGRNRCRNLLKIDKNGNLIL